MSKKGVVNIRGKEYKTVIMRVNEFREKFTPADGWCIRTWLVSNQDDRVIIQATICDKDDHIVAQGFAEENRKDGKINATSAIENAETSAIGRALAAFGLGGEEYCSADELMGALAAQEKKEEHPKPEEKKADDHNPVEKKAEEVKERPDPKTSIVKHLGELEELVGEEEAQKRWITLLRHSDFSSGKMSLGEITNVTNLWRLRDEVVEMVEAVKRVGKKEEE